jgi:hypothetical protein
MGRLVTATILEGCMQALTADPVGVKTHALKKQRTDWSNSDAGCSSFK